MSASRIELEPFRVQAEDPRTSPETRLRGRWSQVDGELRQHGDFYHPEKLLRLRHKVLERPYGLAASVNSSLDVNVLGKKNQSENRQPGDTEEFQWARD
ncbi:hypothetical protein TWF788_010080 [Orbilia oligospora]|uniref:Uncharacterized protein n=1 Tax=Orbilia oligospora TaxID=2813651 RepID=A0A7C8PQF6_ORBOL|nr:hypothetical protein TWF788_010080 [Orbilia oligospora]